MSDIDLNNFRMNAKGNLVALENIPDIDQLRDKTVSHLVKLANEEQQRMKAFKIRIYLLFDVFLERSAAEHDVKWGGKVGNVSLINYAGTEKVELSVSPRVTYDENLQLGAQQLIDCVNDFTAEDSARAKTLLNKTFNQEEDGTVSVRRLFELKGLDMQSEAWDDGMKLVLSSVKPIDSKEYMRFYVRETPKAQWQPIALDLAKIESRYRPRPAKKKTTEDTTTGANDE